MEGGADTSHCYCATVTVSGCLQDKLIDLLSSKIISALVSDARAERSFSKLTSRLRL